MKKLMVLVLVIGMAGVADVRASTLMLQVFIDGQPYDGSPIPIGTQVDVRVIQDVPNPIGSGGEITITMSASGGSAIDTTPVCGFPGSSGESFDCCWFWAFNGGVDFIDNGDGTWYARMAKVAGLGLGTPGVGSVCGGIPGSPYVSTMEFSFITSTSEITDVIIGGTWDGVSYDDVFCACYGDLTGDNLVSIDDLAALVGYLGPYSTTSPIYQMWPPFIPEELKCVNIFKTPMTTEVINIDDLSAMVAYLGPYSTTTPMYIAPCMPNP